MSSSRVSGIGSLLLGDLMLATACNSFAAMAVNVSASALGGQRMPRIGSLADRKRQRQPPEERHAHLGGGGFSAPAC